MTYFDASVMTTTDDLTRIEGINLSIGNVLNRAGISTYSALSAMPVVKIREILAHAGTRTAFRDPATWPMQASLAAAGQWNKLSVWQEELRHGSIRLAADPGEEE